MAISDKIGNVFNKAKSGTIAVSLEAKKKMKESSIKGEISSLESKMNSVFTDIGKEAYSSQYDKLYGYDKLHDLMDAIKDLKDQISVKEKELLDALAEIDREIAEVKGEAPKTESAPAEDKSAEAPEAATGGKVFCGQCGAQNNTDSKFCNSCGAKI
ncbi:MAG: zinc-ribbon domain-containing protein [Eubacteriales bacterium]